MEEAGRRATPRGWLLLRFVNLVWRQAGEVSLLISYPPDSQSDRVCTLTILCTRAGIAQSPQWLGYWPRDLGIVVLRPAASTTHKAHSCPIYWWFFPAIKVAWAWGSPYRAVIKHKWRLVVPRQAARLPSRTVGDQLPIAVFLSPSKRMSYRHLEFKIVLIWRKFEIQSNPVITTSVYTTPRI